MGHRTDGILLIDKQAGGTSHGVVMKVKSALKAAAVRRVGHAGTLDPFATGLLVVLIGQATKISTYVMSQTKIYRATMRLGVETDTLDLTGRVVRTGVVPDLTMGCIKEKSRCFVGPIEQAPPAYSAVKYRGARAYKLARKGAEIALEKRQVIVHSLSILSVDLPDLTMEVTCSSGTYIRSLAADLGRALGPGGHLRSLRRLASGSFEVQHALRESEIDAQGNDPAFLNRIIPLRVALPHLEEIGVDSGTAKRIRLGHQPDWKELTGSSRPSAGMDGPVKIVSDGELIAIAKVKTNEGDDHGNVKIARVFL